MPQLRERTIAHNLNKTMYLIFFFCLLIFKEPIILSKEVKYKALYLTYKSFLYKLFLIKNVGKIYMNVIALFFALGHQAIIYCQRFYRT